MNYADIKGGTWFPKGGMYSIVDAMYKLAIELGVQFHFNKNVTQINIENAKGKKNYSAEKHGEISHFDADVIISNADYHFTENKLLQPQYRNYSEAYWNKKTMAPSCILFYVGLNKKLENIIHHSLFFDTSFIQHANEIYTEQRWPSNPLFYVSATSVTDESSAPPGCENLFFLIPVASGLDNDTDELKRILFQ